MNTAKLSDLLHAATNAAPPAWLLAADISQQLQVERDWIDTLTKRETEIYGVNRRPGHRDDEAVTDKDQVDLQWHILESHLVPTAATSHYDDFQVRCIGLAKACAAALGGTGMTPMLYRHLLNALGDATFQPSVPSAQSYSSGDVIPAAHWSRALLNRHDYASSNSLAPGEAMALINGHFVHAGLALSGLPALRNCGEHLALAFAAIAVASGAPCATFERSAAPDDEAAPLLDHVIQQVADAGQNRAVPAQVAVSIRGIPEVLASFSLTTTQLVQTIGRALETPSGNPLYNVEHKQVLSQGSFLAPSMSIAQSASTEALLLAAWALVAQIQYLLSGRVPNIPVDGKTPADPLGMIQVPKAMMATLEHLRMTFGRRGFASGASTSNGIEDLWTHGESLSAQLRTLTDAVSELAIRAQAVCSILSSPETRSSTLGTEPLPSLQPSATMRQLAVTEQSLRVTSPQLDFMNWAVSIKALSVPAGSQ